MQRGALLRADQRDPVRVVGFQFLMVLDSLIEVGEMFLIVGKKMQRRDSSRCGRVCSRVGRSRMLRRGAPAGFFCVNLLFQSIMSLAEFGSSLHSLIARLLQRDRASTQGAPSHEVRPQI